MKILFVFPSSLDETGNPLKVKKGLVPPPILPILDSLTPEVHSVEIVNDMTEEIDFSKKYDLVGISAMTFQAVRAYQIADIFRVKGTKVIIGGMHATAMPEDAKSHADSVVIGEVDDIWEQILDDCENNKLKDFYKAEQFPDLQNFVIPRWDRMDIKNYYKAGKKPMMPLFTSRGCPMGCKFCTVTRFFGKTYRTKPIAKVLEEIDSISADFYFFADDNIAFDPDYSGELFKALKKKNIKWLAQISSGVIKHPELIELAAESGCYDLYVGLESVNPEALKYANKSFNKVEKYEELIALMHNAGIAITASMIIGFDEDSVDQSERILQFLQKNRVSQAYIFILTPIPGSKLFEEMKETGRLKHYDWSKYDAMHLVFDSPNFSEEMLISAREKFYKEFYSYKNIISNSWYRAKCRKQYGSFISEFYYALGYLYFYRIGCAETYL